MRHFFDDVNEIRMPDGSRVPFKSDANGYPLGVIYGPPLPNAVCHSARKAVAALAARLSDELALVWRRLGYPFNKQWQQALHSSPGAFPRSVARAGTLPDVDRFAEPAVLSGRMRKLPLFQGPRLHTAAPGERIYMDGCGPVLPSLLHRYTDYVGCVCAGSGYARLYPCHGQDQRAATAALSLFIAELRQLLRSQGYLSPLLVRTDGGAAFVSSRFREFCSRSQTRLSLAAPYTPAQNSFVERMWGTRFGTARVLLAAAGLPVRFHVHALQTANWLHNRLPSLDRGGKSPYEILTGEKPDFSHLRAFGCSVAVLRPSAHRTDDKGHKKLTADRAWFGLYLGPSEDHPAHVCYIPAENRLFTSVHCHFDEQTFPGCKHIMATDWAVALDNAALVPLDEPVVGDHDLAASSTDPADGGELAGSLPSDSDTITRHVPSPPSPVSMSSPAPPPPPVTELPATVVHTSPPAVVTASVTSTPAASSVDRGLDGRAWLTDGPVHIGVDGRAKRRTTARVESGLVRAYHDLTGYAATPSRLALHAAPLMDSTPVFAYSASSAAAPLPHPSLRMDDCPVPKGYVKAMRDVHAEYWTAAVEKEWTGIMSNNTLDFVKRSSMPRGANLMNSHFVFDVKPRPDGSVEKFKARLVADGNTQQYGIDFAHVFATVVKLSSVRIVLALAARYDWGLWQFDVQQAFLQADLSEPLYMRMPPHLPDRDADGDLVVCRLKKTLYGLKQSARAWSDKLAATLRDFGFQQSVIDTCVYFWRSGSRTMLLCVYVDDLILAYSDDESRSNFASFLTAALPIDDRGELQWVLRMGVARDRARRTITVSQEQYAARVVAKYLPPDGAPRSYDSPLDHTEALSVEQAPSLGSPEHSAMAPHRAAYMSIVGALLWLAAGTRPDLTYAVSLLARFCSNPAPAHRAALLRVLAYVSASASRCLVFSPDGTAEVGVYSDASWAAKHSVSGGLVYYLGCPVVWWSRLQKSVAASTAEAEYFAAALASREGVFIRDFLESIGFPVTKPTPLYLDSKAALDLTADPVAFRKTKHILRHAYELRDRVLRRVFAPEFVPTDDQLADILTKALRVGPHLLLLDRILPARPLS